MTAGDRRKIWVISSWLISAIVHLSLAIVLVLWLAPLRQSEQEASTLHVAWAEDEPVEIGLAQFTSSLEAAPINDPADSPLWDELANEDDALEVSLVGHGAVRTGRPGSARRGGAANPAAGAAGQESSRAEFFGTVAYGDRFVYLLDMSLSMERNVDQQGNRFDRAREELLRSIEQLDERQSFCVTLFCYDTRPMFDDPVHGRQYIPATPENKERLKAWLRRIKPGPGTDPRDALAAGLALRPSAVFLLSDGDFNGPPRSSGALFGRPGKLTDTADDAQEAHVPVHTIAYEDPAGATNMRELSERSGGEYRFVAASAEATRNQTGRGRTAATNTERLAAKEFLLGKGHESLGRAEKAMTQYRLVIAKYPASNAAREAATRLARLSPGSAGGE